MTLSKARRAPFKLAAVLLLQACLAQADQSSYARFDLYVVDSAFNLGKAKTGGFASVGHTPWLGDGKEYTGLQCQKKLGKEWEELWVEFVPEGDGQVEINLQGQYYDMQAPDDIRLVWVDHASVEGATLINGSFEEQGGDGQPVGWRVTGDFKTNRYSRDGRVAQDG